MKVAQLNTWLTNLCQINKSQTKVFILIFLFFTCASLKSYTQHKSTNLIDDDIYYIYTFEPNDIDENPNDNKEINNFDSLEINNPEVWQIGKLNKADWDSAWVGEYALMTDTVNLIDTNTKASFTFKSQRPDYGDCFLFWEVDIFHQYDFPHKKTGAYIEYSYNKGETWTNINYDTMAFAIYHTRPNHDPAFIEELDYGQLGLNGIVAWERNTLTHELARKELVDFWLKFTFENYDTIAHKGWAIDEIQIWLGSHSCESDVEENNALNAKVYPNPVSQGSVLEFNNPNKQEFFLQIYDILGNKVYESYVCENKHKLPYNLLKAGYYLYELKGINGAAVSGRFMVE